MSAELELLTDKRVPVVVDTDVSDDVDDIWALLLLLQSPEFDIRLITCSCNNSLAKTKVVARILERFGRADIPIAVGAPGDTGQRQTWAWDWWETDYDLSAYGGVVHEDGVAALAETIRDCPEPPTFLAIGPMATVAELVRRYPDVPPRADWIAMAGSVKRGYEGAGEISREYNVAILIDDARTVFSAPWRSAALAPLDATNIRLTGDDYQRVVQADNVVSMTIDENYAPFYRERLRERNDGLTEEQIEAMTREQVASGSSCLFDTVAVYMALSREWLEMEPYGLTVDDEGYTRIDDSAPKLDCAMAWRDQDAFTRFLVERLMR